MRFEIFWSYPFKFCFQVSSDPENRTYFSKSTCTCGSLQRERPNPGYPKEPYPISPFPKDYQNPSYPRDRDPPYPTVVPITSSLSSRVPEYPSNPGPAPKKQTVRSVKRKSGLPVGPGAPYGTWVSTSTSSDKGYQSEDDLLTKSAFEGRDRQPEMPRATSSVDVTSVFLSSFVFRFLLKFIAKFGSPSCSINCYRGQRGLMAWEVKFFHYLWHCVILFLQVFLLGPRLPRTVGTFQESVGAQVLPQPWTPRCRGCQNETAAAHRCSNRSEWIERFFKLGCRKGPKRRQLNIHWYWAVSKIDFWLSINQVSLWHLELG